MSSQASDITFLINSLGEGGAQRVMVTLAKQFVKEGKNVTILSLAKNNFYDLPSEVNMVYFSNKSRDSTLSIPYYAWKLKQYVKKNNIHIVQSHIFRANFVNLFSKILGSKQQAQVSNRSVVSRFFSEGMTGKINLLLISLLYKKADLIIYISERMKLDFHEQFTMRKKEVVIYNPYDIDMILEQANEEVENFTFNREKRYLITIGRLIPLKRFQDVIEAMQKLPSDVELILLGDGTEQASLEVLAKKYTLEKRIHFLGQVKNPFAYIKRSDIFVSSSSVEGFPNVLVEAMLCQTAVVSSDCISGPREILAPTTDSSKQIIQGVEQADYGVLYAVGDVRGLSDAINLLLNDSNLRRKYIDKAFTRAKLFSVENISMAYKELFKYKIKLYI